MKHFLKNHFKYYEEMLFCSLNRQIDDVVSMQSILVFFVFVIKDQSTYVIIRRLYRVINKGFFVLEIMNNWNSDRMKRIYNNFDLSIKIDFNISHD